MTNQCARSTLMRNRARRNNRVSIHLHCPNANMVDKKKYHGKRAALILDFDSLQEAAEIEDCEIDYREFLTFLQEGTDWEYQYVLALVSINPKNPTARDRWIDHLRRSGYIVKPIDAKFVQGSMVSYVPLTLVQEASRLVYKEGFSYLTLVTGAEELIPFTASLRRDAVQVELVQYEDHIPYELTTTATGFINLSNLIQSDEEKEEENQETEEEER